MKGVSHMLKTQGQRVLVYVVLAYTTAALAYSFFTGNAEFVYYSLWLVIFIAGILWMHTRVRIPTPILVGLAIWGGVHLAGGTIPIPARFLDEGETNLTLYNMRVHPSLPKYDQVVHCYGFFMATLCAWAGLRATYSRPPVPGVGLSVALFCIGMGLGAMNEVIEFIGTRIFPETNVGGFVNTGWDLVSNMTGCILAVAVVQVWARQGERADEPAPVTTPA